MIRIDQALTYPLEDERWQIKLGIGTAVSLVPLAGWILLMGYLMRVARQVIRGDDQTLPEWDDWLGLARDGLRWLGVVVLWHLPLLALAVLIIPTSLVTTADVEDVFGRSGGFLRFIAYAAIAAYVTLVAFLLPAALARAAESRSLREGVEYLAVPRVVQANLVVYVAVFLVTAGLAELAKILAIIPFLGVVVAWAYLAPVIGHLYGQAFRIAISGGLHRQPTSAAQLNDETIDLWQAIENVVGVPGWRRRLLIALVLGAIPIVGWALLLGYAARIVRTIADGSIEARPEFDNYEEMAFDGAQALGVILVWTIPVWADISRATWPWSWLVYGELGARLTGFGLPDVPWGAFLYPSAIGFSFGSVLLSVLGIAAQVLLPALVSRVVAERSLVLGFDVVGAWELIRAHPIPYACVVVVQLGVFSLTAIGFSLLYVGLGVVFGAGTLLVAHLYGQLYRIAEPDYVA